MGTLDRPAGKVSHRLLASAALCLLGLAGTPTLADTPKHRQVADLRYGESLFHYYSGDYPAALTRLMVAETEGGIQDHEHYPELMAAGMQLAFGMPTSAEQAFDRLLGQGEPPVVRDTAHYHLAKLHYTEGQYARAQHHLQQLGDNLSPRLADEAALMRMHLALKTGADAETAREQLPESTSRALGLLNLGHAAAREGEGENARQYYRQLLALPPARGQSDQAYLALRDKAYTALGYSLLGERQYSTARDAFQQVRRDTALANPALLGYGWTAASYGDYKLALRPWQVLRQRSLQDTQVLQSLVAIPWAYEKLGAPGEALAAYRQSEALLTREYEQTGHWLDQLDGAAVIGLLTGERQPHWLTRKTEPRNAHWLTLDTTQLLGSDRDHLQQLLGRGDFQTDTQTLKDLLILDENLANWQEKLAIYRDMLLTKDARRGELHGDNPHGDTHRQQLAEWRELDAQLTTIRERRDVMALADEDTRALYRRAENSREHLQALAAAGREVSAETEKLRLLQGILHWRAAQAFPDNLWRAEKALAQTRATIAANGDLHERIDHTLNAGSDITAQVARLDALTERNRRELAALDIGIARQADHLADRLAGALLQHQSLLRDYLAQTRLHIARLYQRAGMEAAP